LKPFSGRDRLTFERTEAFGFNLMNQPELSKLLFLSSKYVLQGEIPEMAFQKALEELCGQSFKSFLNQHAETFLTKGLDNFDSQEKSELLKKLSLYSDPGAKEISDWLLGIYNVGSECLTD
jgi:hypothetical protein